LKSILTVLSPTLLNVASSSCSVWNASSSIWVRECYLEDGHVFEVELLLFKGVVVLRVVFPQPLKCPFVQLEFL
jgi:hypothetical protein